MDKYGQRLTDWDVSRGKWYLKLIFCKFIKGLNTNIAPKMHEIASLATYNFKFFHGGRMVVNPPRLTWPFRPCFMPLVMLVWPPVKKINSNESPYITRKSWGKSKYSHWFFCVQDFAIVWTASKSYAYMCFIIQVSNKQFTTLHVACWSCAGDYWHLVCTATTLGQYSLVQLSHLVGKVCIWAVWLTGPELIQVSVAWSD